MGPSKTARESELCSSVVTCFKWWEAEFGIVPLSVPTQRNLLCVVLPMLGLPHRMPGERGLLQTWSILTFL